MAKKDILNIEYYTIKDVCQMLRISDRTVRRLLDDGCIKAIQVKGAYRIPKQSVAKYLETLYDAAGITDKEMSIVV